MGTSRWMGATPMALGPAAASNAMLRTAIALIFAITLGGCSGKTSGSATTSTSDSAATKPTSSTTTSRSTTAFDPCKDIPAEVITRLGLVGPPRPDSQSGGGTENVFCMYDSSGGYFLTIAASNYTLDKLRNANNHWGYRDLEIGGRQALFGYGKPEPDTESCALNIAASTGVYGVLIGTAHHSFAPYTDCLDAARKTAEALVPYFPE